MDSLIDGILSWKVRIILFTLLFLAFMVFRWVKQRQWQLSLFERLGMPHVKPHLISGSFNQISADRGFGHLTIIGKWIKKHGKCFGFYVGWRPYMVVADLDMIKTILVKDFQNFSNRPSLVIEAQPVIDTLVGLRDQRWKEVRSLLIPTFSMAKLKTIFGILDRKVDVMLEIIKEKSSRDEAIEWYSTQQGLTLDAICESALAIKTNCQRDQENDFLLTAVRQYLLVAVNPAIKLAIYFPFFAFLLGLVSNHLSMSGKLTKTIVTNLKEVMEVRRKDLSKRSVDLLQLMLESGENPPRSDESASKAQPNSKALLSDKEIIANAWVFLLGGFETTASCLTYTTYLLAKHPEIQEKLYEDILTVLKDFDGSFTYESIGKMSYLEQVLNESLRLYPPVATFISREAKEDTEIKGVHIPKGMFVHIPVWNIHRDPEIWEEPEKFDPDRFSSSRKEDRHPMAFIPFGAGPRNCIGMRFGLLEAKLALARIVYNYKLECCEKTPEVLTMMIPTVTLIPVEEVFMKAIPRR